MRNIKNYNSPRSDIFPEALAYPIRLVNKLEGMLELHHPKKYIRDFYFEFLRLVQSDRAGGDMYQVPKSKKGNVPIDGTKY